MSDNCACVELISHRRSIAKLSTNSPITSMNFDESTIMDGAWRQQSSVFTLTPSNDDSINLSYDTNNDYENDDISQKRKSLIIAMSGLHISSERKRKKRDRKRVIPGDWRLRVRSYLQSNGYLSEETSNHIICVDNFCQKSSPQARDDLLFEKCPEISKKYFIDTEKPTCSVTTKPKDSGATRKISLAKTNSAYEKSKNVLQTDDSKIIESENGFVADSEKRNDINENENATGNCSATIGKDLKQQNSTYSCKNVLRAQNGKCPVQISRERRQSLKCRRRSGQFVSVAEAILKFQRGTPKRFRMERKNIGSTKRLRATTMSTTAPPPSARTKPKLTCAQSPNLLCRARAGRTVAKTVEFGKSEKKNVASSKSTLKLSEANPTGVSILREQNTLRTLDNLNLPSSSVSLKGQHRIKSVRSIARTNVTTEKLSSCSLSFQERNNLLMEKKKNRMDRAREEEKQTRIFHAKPAPNFKSVPVRGTCGYSLQSTNVKRSGTRTTENRENIPPPSNQVSTSNRVRSKKSSPGKTKKDCA